MMVSECAGEYSAGVGSEIADGPHTTLRSWSVTLGK